MHYLLVILFSFYPTFFIYNAIPISWMKSVDAIIPNGNGFFFTHLALFVLIFFIMYKVCGRFISSGYFAEKRSLIANILMIFFVFLLLVITFYNILPGEKLFASPEILDNYVLKNPYTFIALAIPWIYLFFD